jgi:hypothetical protein
MMEITSVKINSRSKIYLIKSGSEVRIIKTNKGTVKKEFTYSFKVDIECGLKTCIVTAITITKYLNNQRLNMDIESLRGY